MDQPASCVEVPWQLYELRDEFESLGEWSAMFPNAPPGFLSSFRCASFAQLAEQLYLAYTTRHKNNIEERAFDSEWVHITFPSNKEIRFRIRNPDPVLGYPLVEMEHRPEVIENLPNVLVAFLRGDTLFAGLRGKLWDATKSQAEKGALMIEFADLRHLAQSPTITKQVPLANPTRMRSDREIRSLEGKDLPEIKDMPLRIAPQFPSPPEGSIVTTAHCLRLLAQLFSCDFCFVTRVLRLRLEVVNNRLHMSVYEEDEIVPKHKHEDKGSLGERFEAAITTAGDTTTTAIYTFNTMMIGDLRVCYTAQQDALDSRDKVVEVKTQQVKKNKHWQPFLSIHMLVTWWLRDANYLCLAHCEGDTPIRIERLWMTYDFMRLGGKSLNFKLCLSALSNLLMQLYHYSRAWSTGDVYDLTTSYPDLGMMLSKKKSTSGS